jgi:cell surface protein SprA
MIATSFKTSDEFGSAAFNQFRENRLVIAHRLAQSYYAGGTYALDAEGYPVGFGKNSQDVLLPAFVAAYTGKDANKVSTDMPDFFPWWDDVPFK